MDTMELKRANKVTAFWEAGGVACAHFYRTHDKIETVRSTDIAVITAGFVMPEGTEENPVTAQDKLAAFKNFVSANATAFGIQYDPVDRRADSFKFPSRYDAENIGEYSKSLLEMAMDKVFASLQANVVDKMVKSEKLPEGSSVGYRVDAPVIDVTESYQNGFYKYAVVTYPVVMGLNGGATISTTIPVHLTSGQLSKPRAIGDSVLTMTGVKGLLVEGGVLPKVEPKPKAVDTEGEEAAEAEAE